MSALVECHSGYTYAEYPSALHWEGERLKISVVEAEWQTPQGKHFRVRTTDGLSFELVYSEHADEWRIWVV
ncbi:MAG: hypothetical protein FVQ83_04335 [Chloroflexi bacterium]|nr:hypothetical protein [Chloroflexota bacterium]